MRKSSVFIGRSIFVTLTWTCPIKVSAWTTEWALYDVLSKRRHGYYAIYQSSLKNQVISYKNTKEVWAVGKVCGVVLFRNHDTIDT